MATWRNRRWNSPRGLSERLKNSITPPLPSPKLKRAGKEKATIPPGQLPNQPLLNQQLLTRPFHLPFPPLNPLIPGATPMPRRIFGKQAPETAPTLGMEPGLNHDDPRWPTRRKDFYLHLSIHQRILPTNIYHLYSHFPTPSTTLPSKPASTSTSTTLPPPHLPPLPQLVPPYF